MADFRTERDSLGEVRVPDDDLEYDETAGHYRYGDIDWQEFIDVVSGNGKCNIERMQTRRNAHDNGAWVREAAQAYAEKRAAREAA